MKNLRNMRENLNLNQRDMASKLNLSKATYARYETGETEPNFATLMQIADYFGCSTDHLLNHKVAHQIDKFKYNAEQLAVIEELEKLNKEQCFALLAFIEGMKSGKTRQDSIIAKLNGGNNEFNAN